MQQGPFETTSANCPGHGRHGDAIAPSVPLQCDDKSCCDRPPRQPLARARKHRAAWQPGAL